MIPPIVYRYRPLSSDVREREINTLEKDQIWLSAPSSFDDPWDCFLSPELINLPTAATNLINRLRIACFSDREDNTRMWSHYADSHKGICIGYKTNGSSLNSWNLKEVTYSDKIPESFNPDIDDSVYCKKTFEDLVTTKSSDWDDQNEFRFISWDCYDNLIDVNREDIASITFGVKCSESDK